MGLFQRKRFVWNEPWFFQQRIRTAKGWMICSLFLLTVAMAVGAAMYFGAPAAKRMHVLEIIGLSVGNATAVWWLLDGSNTRRQAVLFEDTLVVGGDMGKYSHPTTYKLSEIPQRGDRDAGGIEMAGARLVLSLQGRRTSDWD